MATINPTSLVNGLSEVIEEDLSLGVQNSLPELDPVFKNLFNTSMGVTREGIGRAWQVIHTFREGLSGAFKWQPVGGGNPLDGLTHGVYLGDNATVFPALDEQSTPGHIQKKISLAKGMGNIFIPTEFIRSSQLSAAITDAVAEVITGAAENCALAEIQAWYSMSSKGEIATIAETPTFSNNRGTGDKAAFAVKGGSVRQFYSGMFVDIHDSAGTTKRATGTLVVDGVRYLPSTSGDSGGYGEVTVQSVDSGAVDLENTAGVVSGDIIVRKDSISTAGASYGPIGPERWLVATGTIFNINVATYAQFQSINQAVSGVFTERTANRYFGRFFQAYGMSNMADTIITSMGVTNAHVENSDGLARFDRTGKPFTIATGYEMGAVPFVFNGQKLAWHISAFMPSLSDVTATTHTGGRMWCMKMRKQNIRRYVPPGLPQAKKHGAFHSEVEFLYPLGGPHGIFKPYHDSGTARATNFQEAPFYRHMAWVPMFMPGIKLTSLTESL